MARKRENYDSEIVNLRAFYIRLLGKIWQLFAAALVGAVIFGGVYYLSNTVFAPDRNYVSDSTLYIYFAYDENKGSEVDYYNAYTWNILIKTDDILNKVMDNLSAAGYLENEVSRDRVMNAMNADIPSDVRVMVFTVKDTDKDVCAAIASAANDAMVNYGETNPAFTQIKVLGTSGVKPESGTDRLVTAMIFGAITGTILIILALLIAESMNDAIYVPEIAERRYSQPVIGILTKSGQDEPSFFRNELLEVAETTLKNIDRAAVICVDDKTGYDGAVNGTDRLKEVLGSAYDESNMELLPLPLPGNDMKVKDELKKVRGVIVLIKMGKRNSAMTEHLLSQLKKLECPVLGIIITEADRRFLKQYLGL